MKMLADVKDSVLVGWNGDKHCLRLKGLKREKNGQAEHAVSMPLREGQERLDIVAVPLAVDEGRKRCRPFVVGVPSEQFLHFRIVVFEQEDQATLNLRGSRRIHLSTSVFHREED